MTVQPKTLKRCVSFTTAVSYNLRELANSLKRKEYLTSLSRDVLYIRDLENQADIFFFNHGSFVCWGLTKRQETKWINYLRDYALEPLSHVEEDRFCYRIHDEQSSIDTHERFRVDIICLLYTSPSPRD